VEEVDNPAEYGGREHLSASFGEELVRQPSTTIVDKVDYIAQ